MKHTLIRLSILAALVLPLVPIPAVRADEPVSSRLEILAAPSTVAIMRHALAPGTGDPGAFRLGDCATQRNLDARGRAQARAIGAAIRASGVQIDRVLTSQWCRCRETAALLDVGPVEDAPMLNSFFEDRSTADDQTEALRAFLAALPPDETVMLVTHQVNITALTGRGVSSGEVFVIRSGPDAGPDSGTVMDEILIDP